MLERREGLAPDWLSRRLAQACTHARSTHPRRLPPNQIVDPCSLCFRRAPTRIRDKRPQAHASERGTGADSACLQLALSSLREIFRRTHTSSWPTEPPELAAPGIPL